MKILAFVDMHGSLTAFEKIKSKAEKADIIVCCGDFTIFEQGLEHFLNVFNKLNKPFLLIHGNHEEDQVLAHLSKQYSNIHFIHNNHFVKDDVLFLAWGGGGFSMHDTDFEKQIKKFKGLIDKNKDKAVVFISHAPPYKTKLDYIVGNHNGNKSFRKFIEENRISLSLCGHFHENKDKIDKIGKTTIINPGPNGALINL